MPERGPQSEGASTPDVGPAVEPTTDVAGSTEGYVPGLTPDPTATRAATTPRPPTARTPTPRMPGSQPPRSAGYWPAVAIIAIVVATAGWTTVAVMAINGRGATAEVASSPPDTTDDPNALSSDDGADFSDAPVEDSHDAPDLEALLPTAISGTPLSLQSWTGDSLLTEGDQWSDSVTAWLTKVGKTPADLSAAQAFDATESTDHSVGVFRLDGIPTKDLRDAMIAAWKESYPELVVSTVKLDGTEVTKGAFGEGAIDSYWYEKDGLVFDVETSDQAVATTIVADLRDGTHNAASGSPASSAGPADSGSPAP